MFERTKRLARSLGASPDDLAMKQNHPPQDTIMTEDNQTDDETSTDTLFDSADARETAESLAHEAFAPMAIDGLLDEVDHPDVFRYVLGRYGGWQPHDCGCENERFCEHDARTLPGANDDITESVEHWRDAMATWDEKVASFRENASEGCDCGGCTCNASTDLPPEDDPTFADGGVDIDSWPAGGRSAWEAERRRRIDEDGTDDASRANYSAIPGRFERGRQADEGAEYPAGGRSAWLRRQAGVSEIPDAEDADALPENVSTRSGYLNRKNNAAPSTTELADAWRERRRRRFSGDAR